MENQSDGVGSEQISDGFICCVCLDLLYKPIVLACGHVACFWCVHKSMNGLRESHCPICRHSYHHFPTICQMLHFLFLKMYPITYKSRENQTLEVEKKMGCFSPHIDGLVCTSHMNLELNRMGDLGKSSATSSQDELSSDPCSIRKEEACPNIKQLSFVPSVQETGKNNPQEISTKGFEAISTISVEGNLCQRSSNGTCKRVSIFDVLCAACKQLLCRPVVLNCGHVYCEACIVIPANETFRCQLCQNPHPWGFPKVCLELDHFLEEQFPTEYALRSGTARLKQVHFQHERPTTCSTKADKQDIHFSFPAQDNFLAWWGDHGSKVHVGAGCDSCGMFPIIGDRYRCKDCVEAIGFDLCGDCYNTRSKRPGRFNQQHTPEHRFEILKSNSLRNIMLRLFRGHFDERSAAPILSNDAFDNSENVIPSSPNDAPENAGNDLAAHVTPSDGVEDQSDTQSPM